ncbi:dTDP-glucose 4,6-dehydratase [Streptomyces candidus]|uniref:dTDP-glucose 4,6-dehydratase n=1 Tax=Streptomyces candidus TaxID=67283 RepID=A0A7X0HI07_9ACTN|nr:dTDP-glucose 4,6-dehydratase [Streptomyces candidus]MBB6436702.1 dTDP-glucose 4,6-dehydratase [Streptomyces candidus]GHH51127.1 dTDP-glucose 4,6-dehydratase [Streptomyces candidus]
MKVFVTGGAGFIGSAYVRNLLDGRYPGFEHAEVTVLDKLTYAGNRANLPPAHPRLAFVHGDVCHRDLLAALLPGHDVVVHFAAESHVDRSLVDASDFVRTNVLGTQTLLDACVAAGVQRVVHISTDEVYGSIAHGSWQEGQPLLPNSPYAASKAAADLIARSYWRSHGLDLSLTRCSNNYGPHQHVEKLIPRFVTRLLEGLPVGLYGDGRNSREWLHVDDHCGAVQRVLTHGRAGEIYHVGSGNEHTNREITDLLLDLCGADPALVRAVPDRKAHDRRYSLDDRKIRDELGFAPRVPFAQGLADTVAWYREHPHWWRAPAAAGTREEAR